jgi:hypothetical protein
VRLSTNYSFCFFSCGGSSSFQSVNDHCSVGSSFFCATDCCHSGYSFLCAKDRGLLWLANFVGQRTNSCSVSRCKNLGRRFSFQCCLPFQLLSAASCDARTSAAARNSFFEHSLHVNRSVHKSSTAHQALNPLSYSFIFCAPLHNYWRNSRPG